MPNQTTHGPGLHHIAVRARDLNKSVRFYVEGLGFTNAYQWPSGERRIALLDAGDGNYVEVIENKNAPEESPEGALMHFALRSADAAESYRRALAAGAKPHSEPKDVVIEGSGARSSEKVTITIAFCKGPDGEIVEFFQNPVL